MKFEQDVVDEIVNKFEAGKARIGMKVYIDYKDIFDHVMNTYDLDSYSKVVYFLKHGEQKKCKNGNDLKFMGYFKGYGFCGKRDTCECNKEVAVNTKLKSHAEYNEIPVETKEITPDIKDMIIQEFESTNCRSSSTVYNKFKEYLYPLKLKKPDAKLSQIIYELKHGNISECENGKFPKFNTYIKGFHKFCASDKSCICNSQNQSEIMTEISANRSDEDKKEIRLKMKNTMVRNHGVDYPMHLDWVVNKVRKTTLENWGDEFFSKTIHFKKAINITSLTKFGVPHFTQNSDVKMKVKDTCDRLYGGQMVQARKASELMFGGNVFASEWFSENREDFYMKALGVTHPMKCSNIKSTMIDNNIIKHGVKYPNQTHYTGVGYIALNDRDVLEHYIENYTVVELMDIFNCKSTVIYNRVNNFNITKPIRNGSSYENILAEYLNNKNISYIWHDYDILYNEITAEKKELDFYIPSVNLAIEINGLYYHSEKMGKDRNYHYNKWKMCKDKGIQLLTIWEDEFLNYNNTWLSKIMHICNKNKKVIHARKCVIKKSEAIDVKSFLDDYHLQGFVSSRIYYGAYYNNELVAVMTFSNTRNNTELQMNRFCIKNNYIVSGIANRLLKKFITDNPHTRSIITYSDNRYSNGGIYEKMGFEKMHDIPPDYSYTKGLKRFHKSNFRKDKISSKFDIDTTGKTEREVMEELKYNRIWDCGKVKWELKIK